MNNNKPLLSICIPTYNRAHYLKDCLDSMVSQFDDLLVRDSIEIVVSDNASQDNTRELVEEYRKEFDNIRYFRNESNLGVDKNLINAAEMASGKYGWHIGDDDMICAGGLRFLMDLLSKNDLAALTVKVTQLFSKNQVIKTDVLIEDAPIVFFNSANEFLLNGNYQVLASVIFDLDLWKQIDKSFYYEGNSCYQIIWKMLPKTSKRSARLDYDIIYARTDCAWVRNGREMFNFLSVLGLTKEMYTYGYKKENVDKLFKIIFGNINKSLAITLLKAKGHDLQCNWKNLKMIFRELSDYPLCLFITVLIYFIPNSFIKIIRDVRKNC